ncbi:hypothetical protein DSO57_1021311 [Entomophthora muscae]|uniref:Uncharacterized protein n=1 Tax=Entomophthora muscae TaxID=34485 RepID=A0ACC2SGF6_9FUNG|nr:hypothetical protein DSO57_1021311 [Entomophthora muscae]
MKCLIRSKNAIPSCKRIDTRSTASRSRCSIVSSIQQPLTYDEKQDDHVKCTDCRDCVEG